LLRAQIIQVEEHFRGAGYNDAAEGHRNRPMVGEGVVSHAVSRLLADVADRTRARHPPRTTSTTSLPPHRGLRDPAGRQPAHGFQRPRRSVPILDSRPGQEVHHRLRRRVRGRRQPHHPHPVRAPRAEATWKVGRLGGRRPGSAGSRRVSRRGAWRRFGSSEPASGPVTCTRLARPGARSDPVRLPVVGDR
jgi:hypothetical protein